MTKYYEDENSTLYHGDCITFMDDMIKRGATVDCSIVDIPYDSVNKNEIEHPKDHMPIRVITKGFADEITFDLEEFCDKLAKVTTKSIYIFCGIEQMPVVFSKFKHELRSEFIARHCIWYKTNPSPINGQHMYLSATENIVFAKRRGAEFHGHCEHNVFTTPAGSSRLHPTEKSQEVLRHLIEMSTSVGDTVFDCCFGSGSTGLAAVGMGRKFLGVELQESCCKIAADRLSFNLQLL